MITLVLPCLDEERSIGACIKEAQKWAQTSATELEIVVADNGSTDTSVQIALELGARVIYVEKKGYGAALDAGIRAARFEYVVMGDSDFSYRFDHIGRFAEELARGADLVVGNRFMGQIFQGAMPWKNRYIGNPILSFLARLFYRVPIGDFHCGLRAVRRDAYLQVSPKSRGMEFATEMILKFAIFGKNVTEVPTDLRPDLRDRPPHLRPWRDGVRHIMLMLMFKPIPTLVAPSLVFASFFSSVLFAILLAGGKIEVGTVEFSLGSAVLSSIFASSAILIAGIGSVMAKVASSKLGIGLESYESNLSRIGRTALVSSGVLGILGLGIVGALLQAWLESGLSNLDVNLTLTFSALGGFLLASATAFLAVALLTRLIQYALD